MDSINPFYSSTLSDFLLVLVTFIYSYTVRCLSKLYPHTHVIIEDWMMSFYVAIAAGIISMDDLLVTKVACPIVIQSTNVEFWKCRKIAIGHQTIFGGRKPYFRFKVIQKVFVPNFNPIFFPVRLEFSNWQA